MTHARGGCVSPVSSSSCSVVSPSSGSPRGSLQRKDFNLEFQISSEVHKVRLR